MKRSLRTKTLTKKSDSIKTYRFRASSHEGIGNPHRKYIYYFYLVQIKIKKIFSCNYIISEDFTRAHTQDSTYILSKLLMPS